jgi:hypothetical protein
LRPDAIERSICTFADIGALRSLPKAAGRSPASSISLVATRSRPRSGAARKARRLALDIWISCGLPARADDGGSLGPRLCYERAQHCRTGEENGVRRNAIGRRTLSTAPWIATPTASNRPILGLMRVARVHFRPGGDRCPSLEQPQQFRFRSAKTRSEGKRLHHFEPQGHRAFVIEQLRPRSLTGRVGEIGNSIIERAGVKPHWLSRVTVSRRATAAWRRSDARTRPRANSPQTVPQVSTHCSDAAIP